MNQDVLNSWKEIAAYVGRGVRTVQRWEQELGFPVRRPRGRERSAVIALKPELDRWLQSVPKGRLGEQPSSPIQAPRISGSHKFYQNTQDLMGYAARLVEHSQRIQEMVTHTLSLTAMLRDRQEQRRAREAEAAARRAALAKGAKQLHAVVHVSLDQLRKKPIDKGYDNKACASSD